MVGGGRRFLCGRGGLSADFVQTAEAQAISVRCWSGALYLDVQCSGNYSTDEGAGGGL